MHVLHHTSVKVVEEEWRVKPLWIRYFISPAVYIFHPVPPSPRLSALWFFSFFCLLKELTVLLRKRVCVLCIVLSLLSSIWWEKLEITMSGGGVRPLCSLFHLFSLWSDALCRSPAGVGLWPPLGQIAHSSLCTHTCTLRCECECTCSNIIIKALARAYTVQAWKWDRKAK